MTIEGKINLIEFIGISVHILFKMNLFKNSYKNVI